MVTSSAPSNIIDFDFPAETTAISNLFRRRCDRMVYDRGNGWLHDILLTEITDDNSTGKFTVVSAKGATPPEECNDTRAFDHFKEVMSNPAHGEYKEMRRWVGLLPDEESWNPKETDIDSGTYKLSDTCL